MYSISEREGKQFEEGLNSKVKLDMYKRFGKEVGICMGLVMQELDYCLSLGQEPEEVGHTSYMT